MKNSEISGMIGDKADETSKKAQAEENSKKTKEIEQEKEKNSEIKT